MVSIKAKRNHHSYTHNEPEYRAVTRASAEDSAG